MRNDAVITGEHRVLRRNATKTSLFHVIHRDARLSVFNAHCRGIEAQSDSGCRLIQRAVIKARDRHIVGVHVGRNVGHQARYHQSDQTGITIGPHRDRIAKRITLPAVISKKMCAGIALP